MVSRASFWQGWSFRLVATILLAVAPGAAALALASWQEERRSLQDLKTRAAQLAAFVAAGRDDANGSRTTARLPQEATLVVIDVNGVVRERTPETSEPGLGTALELSYWKADDPPNAAVVARGPDGLARVYARAPLPSGSVVVGLPLSDSVRHGTDEINFSLVVLLGSAFAVILVDGWGSEFAQAWRHRRARLKKRAAGVDMSLLETPVGESLERLHLAHDLKNAIAVMIACTEVMYQHVPPGRVDRELVEVRRSAERASSIAQELLRQGRAMAMERQPIDLNRFVLQRGGILIRLVGSAITLRMQLTPRSTVVRADAAELERILLNLVLNARDAIDDTGVVSLETAIVARVDPGVSIFAGEHAAGPFVRLTIEDSGRGMATDVLARVSEPFFSTKPGGRGLGLPSVSATVRQLSGALQIQNRAEGSGTRVSVYLPTGENTRSSPGSVTPRDESPTA